VKVPRSTTELHRHN